MSHAPEKSARVCVACNIDVTKKPRVKDPQGRYFCEPCYAKANKLTQKRTGAPSTSTHAQQQSSKRAASAKASENLTNAEFALDRADDGTEGEVLIPEGYDPSLVAAATSMQADVAPPPPSNAFVAKAKEREAKERAKGSKYKSVGAFKCRECGYNMAGVPSLKCPECGHANLSPKDDSLKQTERDVKVAMYKRPLVLMAIGWTISIIALVLSGASWEKYVGLGVWWLLSIPLGVLTFWVSTLIFLEYDAPWHVTAMRLAGIYACVMIADAIAMAVGVNAFGYAALAFMILLYMTELEMEKWEAIAMAIVGFVLKIAGAIALVVLFARLFGGGITGGLAPPPRAGTPTSSGLVSKSNPNGPVYLDTNGDGRDDGTGAPVPADAVPVESLLPPDSPDDGGSVDGEGEPIDDGGG
jgi:rubrerythrin